MNLPTVLSLAALATPVSLAMDNKPKKDASFPISLSHQEMVDLERIPQWSHQFPLIGGGSILREDKKGIIVRINDVQTGPDETFKWLAEKTVFGITPSKDLYLDMHMTQEAFSAVLEGAGILMKQSTFF